MIWRGFIIDLPHILSMRVLIMSCPYALFESKLCITFSISFSVNVIFDKHLSVLGCRKEGMSLLLSMIEHCLAKKEWNNLAFSLKFVRNLLKNWCNTGYFYYYGKTLVLTNMFWDFVDAPINFMEELELCLSLDTLMEIPSKFWRDWKFSKYWLLLLLLLKRLYASFLS